MLQRGIERSPGITYFSGEGRTKHVGQGYQQCRSYRTVVMLLHTNGRMPPTQPGQVRPFPRRQVQRYHRFGKGMPQPLVLLFQNAIEQRGEVWVGYEQGLVTARCHFLFTIAQERPRLLHHLPLLIRHAPKITGELGAQWSNAFTAEEQGNAEGMRMLGKRSC